MMLSLLCVLASGDIIVTAGASQGLAMLANLLFSPGDLVFVEDPTYFIALQALRQDCGLKCVSGRYSLVPRPRGKGLVTIERFLSHRC